MNKKRLNNFESGAHSKHALYFHLVIVTKYRRPYLDLFAVNKLYGYAQGLSAHHALKVKEFNAEKDHIHMLLKVSPTTNITQFICSFKSMSSRLLRGYVKQKDPNYRTLWSKSYCLLTTGGAPIEVIRKYIQSQKTPKK